MAAAKAKVFDNLDPHVQDRLKAYDAQSGEVLNKFERLLLAVTKHQLDAYATFEGDGRNFLLRRAPVPGAPTGRYYFKSQPLAHAHQYRYASPLAQHVVEACKAADTPPRELTFSLNASERVSAAVKELKGRCGELTVKLVTFSHEGQQGRCLRVLHPRRRHHRRRRVARPRVRRRPAGPRLHGHWRQRRQSTSRGSRPTWTSTETSSRRKSKHRNSRYYDQQEELLYRNQQDRKAESEGKIREYRAKESEHRKAANRPTTRWSSCDTRRKPHVGRRAEDEDEDARADRRKLRDEADQYLDLIEQSLKGTQEIEHLFSIRWSVTP